MAIFDVILLSRNGEVCSLRIGTTCFDDRPMGLTAGFRFAANNRAPGTFVGGA